MVECDQFQPQIGNDLGMIGPARHPQMHAFHPGVLRQCQRQTHRPGAARRLHPGNPPAHRGIISAKDVRHQRIDEANVTFRAEIGFAVLRIDQPLFRRLDRGKNRGRALLSSVNADAKVDLVLTRIGGVETDEGEQRVGRLWAESVEDHAAAHGAPSRASQQRLRLSHQKGSQRCFLENFM